MNLDRKYRPKTFEEFVGNEKLVRKIKALLKVGEMPHLMFVGPPGSGKTTMALLVAKNYLGRPININTREGDKDFYKLNASDERGIDTITKDIQLRAQTKSETPNKKRIIFLDEADSLTKDAQHALRAIVEDNEHRCLFIFSLNHIEGIKEPALISRCATFFFKRPTKEQSSELFLDICEKEGVVLESIEMALDIAEYYKGDLRHMLNDCLEASKGYENPVTVEDLYEIYEQTGKSVAERVYKSPNPRKTFFDIYRKEAFDTRQFLEEYYELLGEKAIPYSKAFAKIDARLRMYCSDVIQINYLFTMLEKGV